MPNLLTLTGKARIWARELKRDVQALGYVFSDPACPLLPKLLAGLVAAYALSPVDLIPDFIPVLGYLDDLLIVPLGILLVVRITPAQVMESARAKAEAGPRWGKSRLGLALVLGLWCVLGAVIWWSLKRHR